MNDLERSKVADIINPNQSYPDKWKSMKSKRDERYINAMCNMSKNEMVGTLKRIVAIDEKDRTRNMVRVIRYSMKKEKLDQADRNREKEEKMSDNWEEFKRKDMLNKSKFKKSLDASLKEA